MVSGGHARSGPPRDPSALRHGNVAADGYTLLTVPTEPAPPWPLGDEPSDREASIWADLWARPQASVWPRHQLTRDVAVYARCLAEFEAPGTRNAALGRLVRAQADDLGLTVVGARRNMWRLPTEGRSATVSPLRPAAPRRLSARDRIPRLRDGFTASPDADRAPF